MQSSTVFQVFRVCNCFHIILGCPYSLEFNVSVAISGPEGVLLFRILGAESLWFWDRKTRPAGGLHSLRQAGELIWNHSHLWEMPSTLDPPLALPIMASFRLDSTGKMFFSTSSMGPGLCAIFSLRSSASLALFSFSCLACKEGSAEVSVWGEVNNMASIQQWSTYALQQYFTSIQKGNCT